MISDTYLADRANQTSTALRLTADQTSRYAPQLRELKVLTMIATFSYLLQNIELAQYIDTSSIFARCSLVTCNIQYSDFEGFNANTHLTDLKQGHRIK